MDSYEVLTRRFIRALKSDPRIDFINPENIKVSIRTYKHIEHDALQDFPNLKLVSITKCNIQQIPPNLFTCVASTITHIDFSYNMLSSLEPHTFECLPHLTYLDLSHNHLRKLNMQVFVELPALIKLKLDHNFIESIHKKSFKELNAKSGELVVDLSFNKLLVTEEIALQLERYLPAESKVVLENSFMPDYDFDSCKECKQCYQYVEPIEDKIEDFEVCKFAFKTQGKSRSNFPQKFEYWKPRTATKDKGLPSYHK